MSGKAGTQAIRKAAGRLVQSEAERLVEAGEFDDVVKARMQVRRRWPQVAKAERGKVEAKRVVSSTLPTVRERVEKAVDRRARAAQAAPGGSFGKSIYAVRGECWRTAEGQLLRKLASSPYADEPESAVRKAADGELSRALSVLRSWER